LAIIAAAVMVIADFIGLMAALAAFDEEQQSKEETRRMHSIDGFHLIQ